MGTREIDRGPIAAQVSHNVAELRRARGMSLAQLSEAMTDRAGRPILPTGLSKIETGERRVDVDDLVALALALDVTPARLLLPVRETDPRPGGAFGPQWCRGGEEYDDFVALTSRRAVPWNQAWAWATGDAPLGVDGPNRAWFEQNRPHADPPTDRAQLARQARELRDVIQHLQLVARDLERAARDKDDQWSDDIVDQMNKSKRREHPRG